MPRTNQKPPDNIISLPPHPQRPPSHLDPQEQQLWRSITRTYVIDGPGALELLDVALTARGRMRRCTEAIRKEGEIVRDRWGQAKANPLLVSERGARDSYLKALRL